ncbi:flagella synthesis protein FlgN [Pollutimonas sp. M17]|uniref:flagella synthesis protein FlgN n=1 Tax=Pollutimonas sp. M17 TaxID=2962065 RepID=UPI0021F44360|nr:flagellar protein FlgN [Pollutimonas sp. M17]UYO94951.1 flagellar protein FlgN [Pollutimonas sp. M17]HWK70747.1 flagellar protein FlgN [Burkholderiaceae bacterium]
MNDTLAQLHASLHQETELVQDFIKVLEAETLALTEGGGEQALAESTALKNNYAEELAKLSERRQALLTQLGYSADKAGLDSVAQGHPALQAACRQLYDKARQANELNASNGIIIDTFMAHNQQALETLRMLAGAGNLYDASGRTHAGAKGQTRNIKAG